MVYKYSFYFFIGGIMLEKWFLRNKNNAQSPDRSLNLLERTKLRILYNRDITEIDDMKKYFLNPYEAMYDANLFNDFHILYDRLITLKENNETVAIVGDYDVDGIMSTTILLKTFKRLGISVTYKIPNRMTDGYGINRRIVDELKLEGVSLIITVDNGIQAFDVLEYAKELGLDVFITDHHELKVEDAEFMIPTSIGAINPHRPDSNYPFQLLCGAGIAYKVAILLLKKFGQYDPELDKELITLAGIATICDVVDLVDENRIIAYHGLLNYRETTNIGLRAITKVASVDIKKVDSYHIGFIIGPRFNSSGRLKTADLGIELLTTEDEDRALEIATELNDLNEERKAYTEAGYKSALEKIDSNNLPSALVIYLENIHESVAGIIAGRIKEKYYRPTIVLTDGEENLKGSGRSVDEFDIYSSISEFSDLCTKFGGHKMACGLSIEKDKMDEFKNKLIESANKYESDFVKKVYIDAIFPLEMVDLRFLDMLNSFKPFGKANEEPKFADNNLKFIGFNVLGKNKNVIKLSLVSSSNRVVSAILFETEDAFFKRFKEEFNSDIYESIQNGLYMDIVYYPQLNEFRGNKEAQIIITNYRYKR